MGFFTRLTTLAKADAHGVVDALEDRSLLLRQHLREAAAELERKRCRLSAIESEERDLEQRAERVGQQIKSLEEDIDLALGSDKEDLGRFAIRQLLPLRHTVDEIASRREALQGERSETAFRLTEQEQEYQQLETRVRAYLSRRERGEDDLFTSGAFAHEVSDEEVEIELLRRRRGHVREEATS